MKPFKVRYKNIDTGEVIDREPRTAEERSKDKCRQKLDWLWTLYSLWQKEGKTYLYRITLTLRTKNTIETDTSALNVFLGNLRRKCGRIEYCWTCFAQEKRLKKSGVFALHWHVMLLSPVKLSKSDIKKMWKLGFTDLTKCKNSPDAYYTMHHFGDESIDPHKKYPKQRRSSSSRGLPAMAVWGQIWARSILNKVDDPRNYRLRKKKGCAVIEKRNGRIWQIVAEKSSPWKPTVEKSE